LLKLLLTELLQQETEGLFSYSIVVADNDCEQSAKQVVADFTSRFSNLMTYCVESQKNIALARNKALGNARGDFIAVIDDDEYPAPNWLCSLFNTCNSSGADGVLGPVIPYFEQEPPKWALKGGFFEKRPNYKTGYRLSYSETRTSNVLFRRKILDGQDMLFRAEFGTGGEDVDFFRRHICKGRVFIWCNEAVVYEAVPPTRCTRRYLLRRALHRGNIAFKFRRGAVLGMLKSFIAIPVYAFALPFLFIAGQHHFMKYMIKICDHTGKVLALFGIKPFKEYK
jgi:succinoglycan biosynthesis protein ExoM